jgi:hypothetical protein
MDPQTMFRNSEKEEEYPMKRIGYTCLALAAVVLGFAGIASATPNDNAAILYPRTFNDCPVTNLVSVNGYPANISFDESNMICPGGQNMHVWNFSADGGATPMILSNPDAFHMGATLVLDKGSPVAIEGGLLISKFDGVNTSGYFNVRLPDGEIAAFGGDLPFYSFTVANGLLYTGGAIGLDAIYQPNCLTQADPGRITYIVHYGGNTYTSPALAFGCDVLQEAEHGCWGIQDQVHVGGRVANLMFNGGPGGPNEHNVGSFFDVFFDPLDRNCEVPTTPSTWGKVKAQYR